MELKELRKTIDEIIEGFVNALGLNGKYYVESSKCPMAFSNRIAEGKFFTPQSEDLINFLKHYNLTEEQKKIYLNNGLIAISNKYKEQPADKNFLVSCVHETFHSKRTLLINKQKDINPDYPSILFHDGHFVQNNDDTTPRYVDAAQDVLLASIDSSSNTINKYNEMPDNDKIGIYWENDVYTGKLESQENVDEALIELMSIIAVEAYTKGKSIGETLKKVSESNLHEDLKAMSRIIIRHNDLTLFNWIIMPLEYQVGDVNHDFFANYINDEDKEDAKIIYNFNFNDDYEESSSFKK